MKDEGSEQTARTLGPQAAAHFTPEQGRWPEVESHAERLGVLSAFLGTTASMIAVINSVVAGAIVIDFDPLHFGVLHAPLLVAAVLQ